MIFLLSPAKSLNLDPQWPQPQLPSRTPETQSQAATLISTLRRQTQAQIAQLMGLSVKLAQLNSDRYQNWCAPHTRDNAKPAIFTFDGDVYTGLNVATLNPSQLTWADQHFAILSGLYGILQPLDLIQAHRLEMGTPLKTRNASNLYQYWGALPTQRLNHRLEHDPHPVVINLASQEYFKAIDPKLLKARVIDCIFEQERSGRYQVISFPAKRARGLMARFAILKQATTPLVLKKFNLGGYRYTPTASTPDRMVFRCPENPVPRHEPAP